MGYTVFSPMVGCAWLARANYRGDPQGNRHNMRDKRLIAFAICVIILMIFLLIIRMCQPVNTTVDITPTLIIITASVLPPVASATVTVPIPSVTVAPLPSHIPTRLIPTIAPTLTPTIQPSPTPSPYPTDEFIDIVKGVTYWDSAKYKYNVYEKWQCLRAINGWPERQLPIGERMRLPANCDR